MAEYPMHDKVAAVAKESQAIGEFLEWLSERQWFVAKYTHADPGPFRVEARTVRVGAPIQDLLAEYFEIDLQAMEDEKRAMLRLIAAEQEERDEQSR